MKLFTVVILFVGYLVGFGSANTITSKLDLKK